MPGIQGLKDAEMTQSIQDEIVTGNMAAPLQSGIEEGSRVRGDQLMTDVLESRAVFGIQASRFNLASDVSAEAIGWRAQGAPQSLRQSGFPTSDSAGEGDDHL